MKKKIKVGVDFDGVLAYNPFRIIRAPVSFVKKKFFGVKKTSFYIPKSPIEQYIWRLMHKSSVFPARGTRLLKNLVDNNEIEAHLVTARYKFLQDDLYIWLRRWNLEKIFTSITFNEKNEQPHEFKTRIINEKKLQAFIEDNLDIVLYAGKNTKTKLFWIYNILDWNKNHPEKHPYLEKALQSLQKHFS